MESTFEKITVGSRLMDEFLKRGTVKHKYPDEPVKGAIIVWDDDTRSWPNESQINKMRILPGS